MKEREPQNRRGISTGSKDLGLEIRNPGLSTGISVLTPGESGRADINYNAYNQQSSTEIKP